MRLLVLKIEFCHIQKYYSIIEGFRQQFYEKLRIVNNGRKNIK